MDDSSLKVNASLDDTERCPMSGTGYIGRDQCLKDIARQEEQVQNGLEKWFGNDEAADEFPHELYEEMSVGSESDISIIDTRPTMVEHRNHSIKSAYRINKKYLMDDYTSNDNDAPNVR